MYLIWTGECIIDIKIVYIDDVVLAGFTSSISVIVAKVWIIQGRVGTYLHKKGPFFQFTWKHVKGMHYYVLTSDTIHTWFQMITSLEQEALLVIFGIIRDVEHGPEVAVFNLGAFSLARSEVHYIVVVNVNDIVQCDWASAISKWAKWIWFLSCWNRRYEIGENIYWYI